MSLSEAVCRQLGTIHYQPNVKHLDTEKKSEASKQNQKNQIRLIHTVSFLMQHTAVIPVKVDGSEGTLLLKPDLRLVDLMCIEHSVLEANQEGTAMVVVANSSKISHPLKRNRDSS